MSLANLKAARDAAVGRPFTGQESNTLPAGATRVALVDSNSNGLWLTALDDHADRLVRLADALFAYEARLIAKRAPLSAQRAELLAAINALKE